MSCGEMDFHYSQQSEEKIVGLLLRDMQNEWVCLGFKNLPSRFQCLVPFLTTSKFSTTHLFMANHYVYLFKFLHGVVQ